MGLKQIEPRLKDRSSALPDALLSHILSFLPTKYAVRTGILSRRWKNIWASVPNLYISSEDNKHNHKFDMFVERVLLFHEPLEIPKFHLDCYCCHKNSWLVDGWIRTAVKRKVVELDLRCVRRDPGFVLRLPKSLFMCKTLEVLKVSSTCILYELPKSGCFPNLKFLHVTVSAPYTSAVENLMSHCPVLEHLAIAVDDTICSPLRGVLSINICVPNLKTLTVNLHVPYKDKVNVLVKAPKLETLNVSDDNFSNYSLENAKSIVLKSSYLREKQASIDNVIALLAQVSSVENLCLAPYLKKLNPLELVVHDCHNWEFLIVFLKVTPNLEDLVLEDRNDSTKPYQWNPPESVPIGLSRLKTISIWGFKRCQVDMEGAKYLLKNCIQLNKMTVYTYLLDKEEKELRKEFLVFERSSTGCQLEFL